MHDLLKGVRIVDLSTIVLGPYATQMLADLGADVIKVEAPGGDLFRAARPGRPDGDGAGFLNCNRNKRSIALDLTAAEDHAILMRLVATADVVIHNLRPQSAARLRIDYEAIRAMKPDIIYCAARGFGDGPLGDAPAYDDCIQAASGLAALNAGPDGAPRYVPTILCDKIASLHLATATAAALASRARTGAGACIEVPMYEAIVSFLMVEQLGGATFDPPIGPTGYERLSSPNRRPFATQDGWLAIMPYTLGHWRRYLALVGRADLADDPTLADARLRSASVDRFYAIVAAESPRRTTADWITALTAADIPCAPVNRIADLLTEPHLSHVGLFETLEHPVEGTLRSVRSPFTIADRPITPDHAAPALDADRAAILAELDQLER